MSRVRRIGYRQVIAASGRLGGGAATELSDAFWHAIEEGAQEIWLDLSAATDVGDAAVGAVARIGASAHELNRRAVVICSPGPIRRALHAGGADHDVEVHATLSEAQRAA